MDYKERIKRSFSRAAQTYDQYATVQKEMAARQIGRIGPCEYRNILEIGCGTGIYTELLRQRFPNARITAIDLSPEMISCAVLKLGRTGDIVWRVDDGESFVPGDTTQYDLITSNSAFQWFTNLQKGLEHSRDLLQRDGRLLFSMMGPETFCELHEAIDEVLPHGVKMAVRFFTSSNDIAQLLQGIFGKVGIKEDIFTKRYPGILELLQTIKYTGVNIRFDSSKVIFTPGLLKRAEEVYLRRFGSVTVRYHALFCEATRGIMNNE